MFYQMELYLLCAKVVLLLAETLHVAPSASHPADTEWIATQHDRQKGVAAIAEMIHVRRVWTTCARPNLTSWPIESEMGIYSTTDQ
jgi:hypothetical protein